MRIFASAAAGAGACACASNGAARPAAPAAPKPSAATPPERKLRRELARVAGWSQQAQVRKKFLCFGMCVSLPGGTIRFVLASTTIIAEFSRDQPSVVIPVERRRRESRDPRTPVVVNRVALSATQRHLDRGSARLALRAARRPG